MIFEASTTKERFEEIKKNPLMFCHFSDKTEFDMGRPHTKTGWFSCDSTINLFIPQRDRDGKEGDRLLLLIGDIIEKAGKTVEQNKTNESIVFFAVYTFEYNKPTHWYYIFNDCFYNYKAGNYRHCHMSLIWALYTIDWHEEYLTNALSNCERDKQSVIANQINNSIFLFSISKQNCLVRLLKNFIPSLQAKTISEVEKVLLEMYPSKDFSKLGFYEKIDTIINFGITDGHEAQILRKLYTTSTNSFIHYKYWKETPGHKLYSYTILQDIFSYVSVYEQMNIIKRYLHDVRNNIVEFDENVIKGFRDYKYPGCVDGRYFIERPGTNILMMAPMFCDAIITLRQTKGERLQSFNGILDLAIKHSNRAYPNIDFGIKNFLPFCDGGLIPNNSFYGFIRFDVNYSLDESLLTEENLTSTANYILINYAEKQRHWCCTNNNDTTLTEQEKNRCKKLYIAHKVKKNADGEIVKRWNEEVTCSCAQYKYYNPPRWKRIDSQKDKFLSLCIDGIDDITDMFGFEKVSLVRLEAAIRKWSSHYSNIVFHNDRLPDTFEKNVFAQYIIKTYFRPKTIDFYPNKSVFYSSKKSLLNLWSHEDILNLSSEEQKDKMAQSKESETIFNKSFNILKEMCSDGIISSDHVSIPFNIERLNAIITFFHYRSHKYDLQNDYKKTQTNYLKFLVPRKVYDNIRYCTPKVANERDKVSNLPFFWCRSEECFCNVLEKQTLSKEDNWRKYTLYHAAEIIGHKLIIECEEGNIATNVISNFAAEIRQAERLYERQVCRSCGHMIFSTRGSILNGSRFFSCLNSQCLQHRQEIYLSQCNTCKSGLIDSRDSERCENNWVICPHCLSCCNDNLFQTLYNNHLKNGYVPPRIKANLGKGHNNKHLFFCPKCGGALGKIEKVKQEIRDGQSIEIKEIVRGCPSCNIAYEDQLTKYYDSTNDAST